MREYSHSTVQWGKYSYNTVQWGSTHTVQPSEKLLIQYSPVRKCSHGTNCTIQWGNTHTLQYSEKVLILYSLMRKYSYSTVKWGNTPTVKSNEEILTQYSPMSKYSYSTVQWGSTQNSTVQWGITHTVQPSKYTAKAQFSEEVLTIERAMRTLFRQSQTYKTCSSDSSMARTYWPAAPCNVIRHYSSTTYNRISNNTDL